MSEVKVNKISPRSGTDVTLGDSGDTFTIPSGATLTNNGTATGFGPTGAVSWDTTAKTSGFTAVSGTGYFCNTTSAAFTVTLPATPSAGDIVGLIDYAGTFDTNALVIDPNGNDIQGGTDNLQLTGEREGVTLVYVDATQGWIATSGINEGSGALSPITYPVDFLVIAGGGGGHGGAGGGGGGAGGYRNSYNSESSGGGASAESAITVTSGTTYTVTVGGGGTAGPNLTDGGNGVDSVFSTITSIGGGGGSGTGTGNNGGSGGGATGNHIAGNGTVNQGFAGGDGPSPGPCTKAGGGGGAGGVGSDTASCGGASGAGGIGVDSTITGSTVGRAGGGGGGSNSGAGGSASDGGGAGASSGNGTNGTDDTGGGGGGGSTSSSGGAGGSGIVILRMATSAYSGTTTGSPTVSTNGSDTILTYTGSGSYTG